MMLPFEILNGKEIASGQPLFTSSNRAFRYGDGLFETFRVSNGKILFQEDHFERLNKGLQLLQLQWPATGFKNDFEQAFLKFMQLNESSNLRLRLTVFRESEGYYQPATDQCSWHLCGTALSESHYQVAPKGLEAGLFRDALKAKGNLANCKTLNSLIYVLTGLAARNHGWDEAFLMNSDQHIIEAGSSNIIIRKENSFLTPPLSDGCLDGVMRKNVIRLLLQKGYTVMEQSLSESELENCEEILLTNVISGVRAVEKYGNRQYQNKFASILNGWLNEVLI